MRQGWWTQLAADQAVANDFPAGQGHQFGQEPVYAWASILPPPAWSEQDSDRLADEIGARSLDAIE
ncbi:MAG: alpha/beta-hydrolase family protein [Ornithinimicrobium sp.]